MPLGEEGMWSGERLSNATPDHVCGQLKWYTNSFFKPDSLTVLKSGNLTLPPPLPSPSVICYHYGQSTSTVDESHSVG